MKMENQFVIHYEIKLDMVPLLPRNVVNTRSGLLAGLRRGSVSEII